MDDRDELLSILRAIWNRRASTHEAGISYTCVLDGELCDRIRRVLGEELWGHNQEPLGLETNNEDHSDVSEMQTSLDSDPPAGGRRELAKVSEVRGEEKER